MRLFGTFILACFIGVFQVAKSQEKSLIPKRIYTTKVIADADSPVIDGVIDEGSWDLVEWSSDFVEREPDENTAPAEQTKFKIIYDKKFLYIAFRCYDRDPSKIVRRMSRRDGFEGDWVEINIDSYHDKRSGFSFTSSVSGVKGDEFISNNGNNWDGSWNPIWYLKTNIDEEGWTAEVKIPFSQLKFGNDKEQIWGIQVQRRFFRAEERSTWQRIPLDSPGWVSEFGELQGLKDLEAQKQIEIQPYSASQLNTYPEEKGNPFRDGNDSKLGAGLDAKIGITNDLTLDLTVNPDFGQVDADPAAIALDGFQIFFEERRPFFVENKNIFDFRFADNPDNLFYSRRIGRNPQGRVSLSENEYVDQPKYSTILGAAKFSGKTKTGWSLGVLESVTDNEYAEIDNNGSRREQIVEPLTNYFVGRAQKDFNNRNSFIGGIFTATNRNLRGDDLNYLRKSAYTAGIDFQHNWKNRKYYLIGNVVSSHVTGSREAIAGTQNSLTHLFQRVDASHVAVDTMRTSLTGTGGRVELGKSSVGHWRYNTTVIWRSPELELNDVGFLRQADEVRQYASLSHQTLKPFGQFRRINTRFEQFSSFDFEGNYNRMQYSLSSNANLKSNWNVNAQVVYKPRIYTNTILQGGPRFRYSEEVFKYLNFGSDGRKKFSFFGGIYHSQGKNDSFSYLEYDGGIAYQPINALTISLNPNFAINKSKTQYVTETSFSGNPRYITAELSQHTLNATIRLDYSINPNLTIQYYGQPFISRGIYKSFNKVTNPVADYYGDRISLFQPNQISFTEGEDTYSVDEDSDGTSDYSFQNPDFSQVAFNSNLVVRWEYIPGSEIFLVWSQGIFGNANTRDDLFSGINDQIFHRKPENIFLIKATYRFVL
ncbi:MAG: carbohydrate binding family 9 domain-containing protein [Flavobacterium sp.]|nr:carbohydrate binding family 9 domain-containing protein [Flavobacterium sp.]